MPVDQPLTHKATEYQRHRFAGGADQLAHETVATWRQLERAIPAGERIERSHARQRDHEPLLTVLDGH